nr:hypothetical protein [Tanacetum cinerariifolium]
SSEDSVRTPAGRVILFGTIPTTIPDTTPVITPPTTQTDTTVIPTYTPIIAPTIPPSLDYTAASPDYSPASETESNPSEDPSSDHIPPLPATLPFLSSDNNTIDSDTPDTPPSPAHDHSSLDLPTTSMGPSCKRRRSPMTSIPALPPVSRALFPVCVDLIPSPKRVRDSGYLAYVEVGPRETSLKYDVITRGSDEPHLEKDIDPEIHAEIDECFAYVDALRDKGIDARVVVEAVDRDEIETGVRGPVEVRVERITHHAMQEDIPKPAQEGAVEVTYETLGDLVKRFHDHTEANPFHRMQVIEGVQREQGHRIVRVKSAVTTLTKRVAELERDNGRLRGTASVETSMTHDEVEELAARQVAKEMEAGEAVMNLEPLNENRDKQENGNEGNRGNINKGNGGNGNEGNRGNGNGGNEGTGNGGTRGNRGNGEKGNGNRNVNHVMNYEARLQDAICIANQLMDKKIQGYAARSAENKKRMERNPRDNRGQQSPFKRCGNCKKVGHVTRDCRVTVTPNTQGAAVGNQQGNVCYEFGRPGHFKKDCPKLRSQNRGNQTRNKTGNMTGGNEVTAKVYAIGEGGTNPDSNKSNSVGIGKGKVLLDDFEIVGNGKDKVVLDNVKDGLISTKSDGDQNEGSS